VEKALEVDEIYKKTKGGKTKEPPSPKYFWHQEILRFEMSSYKADEGTGSAIASVSTNIGKGRDTRPRM